MLAGRIKVAYPVLLVVAGLPISLIPGMLLNKNKADDRIDEELIRKFLYGIDLEEEKLKAI